MDKKIIGVVIVTVVLVGGYLFMKRTSAPGSEGMMYDGMMMEGSLHSGAMTAVEILKLNKDQKCTFTRTDANAESAGTAYFSKGKMRGEFDVVAQGQSFKASMISDGVDVYTWSSIMPQGVKTPVSSGAVNDPNNQSFDLDDTVDYTCSSWDADQSMFVLPKDMKFMEIPKGTGSVPAAVPNDVMKKGMPVPGAGNVTEIKAIQCGVCDQAPDAAQKAECRAALGCN